LSIVIVLIKSFVLFKINLLKNAIFIQDGPLEIVRGLEDMTLQEDSDAIFTVELNREHQSVDWYKDDVLIKNGLQRRMYSVDKTYTLRLNQVNPIDHNATYTFKVKDLESSGVLTVIGKNIDLCLLFD